MGLILAQVVSEQIEKFGSYAGYAAILGVAVLSALVIAQGRELRRLRDWAGRSPERAQELEERVAAEAQAAAAHRGSSSVSPARPVTASPSPAARPGPAASPAPQAVPARAPAPAGSAPAAPARPAFVPAGLGAPALASATRYVAPAGDTPPVQPAREPQPDDTILVPAASTAAARAAAGNGAGTRPASRPLGIPAGEARLAPPPPAVEPARNPVPDPRYPPPPRGARPQPTPAAPLRATRPATTAGAKTGARAASGSRRERDRLARRFTLLLVGGVVLLGALGIFAVTRFLGGDGGRPTTSGTGQQAVTDDSGGRPRSFSRGDTTVTVLNGTVTDGLAQQVADDLVQDGFQQGTVATASDQTRSATVISFLPGHRRDAQEVRRALGLGAVEPIDPITRGIVCPDGSECEPTVVVTVGADRVAG